MCGGRCISSEIFDRWHARHPDWRVIQRGKVGTHGAMIEVPSMTPGWYTLGPLWREERGSSSVHKLMDGLTSAASPGAANGISFVDPDLDRYPSP